MAQIRPFAAIKYVPGNRFELSKVIAPPYDVLDEKHKAALQAQDPHNIVNIDLPFLPPKSLGPDEVYERAAITMKSWMSAGILHKDQRRALYPYAQAYDYNGKTYHRRGFIALVKLSPLGQGQVVPHEKTYKGPIEDRLKLMHATRAQLSPIFGLFSDPRNEVNKLLYASVGKPDLDGAMDNVRNQLWSVIDADVEHRVIDLMARKPIYIADGHHRYTTALQYQVDAQQANGGKPLADAHPANWCMFVLVPMQDAGLLILGTHRLIGGLDKFDIEAFKSAVAGVFDVVETPILPERVAEYANAILPDLPAHAMGLYDGRSKKLYQLNCKNPDLLAPLEPNQSQAWRQLDVAILHRYLLDEILQKQFAGGKELTRGYTAYGREIVPQVESGRYQIAMLLKSTPLAALEQLGKSGEVMPQKSTFFVPKLATGMVINPLE